MTAGVRFDRELGNEGGEKAITILLLDVPKMKMKVIIGNRGQSCFVLAFDFLDNCRSSGHYE